MEIRPSEVLNYIPRFLDRMSSGLIKVICEEDGSLRENSPYNPVDELIEELFAGSARILDYVNSFKVEPFIKRKGEYIDSLLGYSK